jgi:hypothetical protein
VKSDGSVGNSYVVAWQNLELTETSPTTVSILTKGLYGQGGMAEIIINTVACRLRGTAKWLPTQSHKSGARLESQYRTFNPNSGRPAAA